MAESDLSARVRRQRGGPPVGAIVAIVIAVAVLVWLLFLRGDDDGDEPEQSAAGPAATKTVELVSGEDLPGAVADVGYPVYWLGPQEEVQYELTVITDGRTYVRYLPPTRRRARPMPIRPWAATRRRARWTFSSA